MQSGYISFCDKIGFNIKSDDFKKGILKTIEETYDIKIVQRHFDNFMEHHTKRLNEKPHIVSLRTNGNPYFLYLTRINYTTDPLNKLLYNVNTAIFIDKKITSNYHFPRIVVTWLNFEDSLFDNTLIDGEMIRCNKDDNWIYMMNDVIAYKDEHLVKHDVCQRLTILNEVIKGFKPDYLDICKIQRKKYVKYDKMDELIKSQRDLKYTCRGLYFTPLYLKFKPILMNFNTTLVKSVDRVKYQDNNAFNTHIVPIKQETIVVTENNNAEYLIERTDSPDVYNVYNLKMEYLDIACVSTLKMSQYLNSLFNDSHIHEKKKIHCEYIENKGYVPVF